MPRLSSKLTTLATLLLAAGSAIAQTSTLRPPSVPLVTHDPYLSLWSPENVATEGNTTHWTGRAQKLVSNVIVDGTPYRILGKGNASPLMQTKLEVTATQTKYTFAGANVEVTLAFMSPLLPDDLMVMSRPVTYVTWSAKSTDGKPHAVSVNLSAGAELVVNNDNQRVAKSAELSTDTVAAVSVGSVEQPVLGSRGDDHRIDWGHLYLAAPRGDRPVFTGSDEGEARRVKPLSVTLELGSVAAAPVSRYAMIAYDDEVSVKYYRTQLKPYWRKDGADAKALLVMAEKEYASLQARCDKFDTELNADMKKIGGDAYVQLGVLSWRQSLAAQKIVADDNGQPLSFSKENNSNGCMATVDVLYPAAPLMIAFSPNLLKASLVPLMDYSASPRWKFDSAPHDLGTYPIVNGQVYGGENSSPMPVEETGNMLILLGALAKTEGNADFAKKYWHTCTLWKDYLVNHGLDPENQLCTDDFAGHIARNANLSAKAIMGIAAWGMMADMLGEKAEGDKAIAIARDYAQKWMKLGDQGDHYGLVFGDKGKGTWSQKYNIVWDKIFETKIFPAEVITKEVAYYKTKMNVYGIPLDSRREYTKLDWELWTATMADKQEDFQAIVDACAKYVNETPTRVPLCDWYETVSGEQSGFKARSVVGGLFIPFLKDKALWEKYSSRDKSKFTSWAEAPLQMPETKIVLPAADKQPVEWKYTFERPGRGWFADDFNTSSWQTGKSGFGAGDPPSAVKTTNWDTSDIWLKREFTLDSLDFNELSLYMYHDEDVEVYINGHQVFRNQGFTSAYDTFPLSKEAIGFLKKGKNTLAVHCRQTTGGQYIDVGLADVLPLKKK